MHREHGEHPPARRTSDLAARRIEEAGEDDTWDVVDELLGETDCPEPHVEPDGRCSHGWLSAGLTRRGDLMPTFATMPTPSGHLCGEVASALQKSIRRGLERESLYWATELDLAGFPDYLLRRLRIIASEDVGMAAPDVAVQVRALSENFTDQRKHNATSKTGTRSSERLFIVQAVIVLCRAPKWRTIDHAVMAV